MRYAFNTVLFTALLLGLASIVHPCSSFADVYDGNWTCW